MERPAQLGQPENPGGTPPPMDTGVPTALPMDTGVPTAPPMDTGVPTALPMDTGVPTALPMDTGVPTALPSTGSSQPAPTAQEVRLDRHFRKMVEDGTERLRKMWSNRLEGEKAKKNSQEKRNVFYSQYATTDVSHKDSADWKSIIHDME